MSGVMPSRRADAVRPMPSLSSRLGRAYCLYRKRIARCHTTNQLNRVHIAIENYITPAELRYFDAALARDSSDSPSRRWITRLCSLMPTRAVRPVEFERRGIVKGATRYTADIGSPGQKTLILAFAGAFKRPML